MHSGKYVTVVIVECLLLIHTYKHAASAHLISDFQLDVYPTDTKVAVFTVVKRDFSPLFTLNACLWSYDTTENILADECGKREKVIKETITYKTMNMFQCLSESFVLLISKINMHHPLQTIYREF